MYYDLWVDERVVWLVLWWADTKETCLELRSSYEKQAYKTWLVNVSLNVKTTLSVT